VVIKVQYNLVGFINCTTERDHNIEIGEPKFLSYYLHPSTFEGKTISVIFIIVARGSSGKIRRLAKLSLGDS